MHKLMNFIKDSRFRIVNVCGISGIGKTRFVTETAYYMYARSNFQDGLDLIDLRGMRTTE